MTTTIDIISQLSKRNGWFSTQEQKVADFILNNLDASVHLSLTEIAKGAGVSVATVNRFCHSLGCDGFKSFKIQLAQNVAVSLQYLNQSTTDESQSDELVNYIFDTLLDVLNRTRLQLDPEVLNDTIERLAQCNRLVFLGVGGGSANVAAEGANRFFRLGIPSVAQSDGYAQRMFASTLKAGDILFIVSSTGWPQELLDSAKIAGQYGATTICLTQKGAPLAEICDVAIILDIPEDGDIFKPSPSRFIFTAVLDVLATGVARRRPTESRENLRRIRSSLVAVHKRTQPHPVGD